MSEWMKRGRGEVGRKRKKEKEEEEEGEKDLRG